MKDYYSILELPVTATLPEIRKAYRRLAMQWHPDKNEENREAFFRFNEIKEAYEVLTNPTAKEQYLQERWLKKASGHRMADEPLTPAVILKQVLELNRSVAQMDVHRMDPDRVEQQIRYLLRDEVVQQLTTFPDAERNRFIFHTLLQCTNALPLPHTRRITTLMHTITGNEPELVQMISKQLQQKQKAANLQKQKPWMILLLVILLCLLIYAAGS